MGFSWIILLLDSQYQFDCIQSNDTTIVINYAKIDDNDTQVWKEHVMMTQDDADDFQCQDREWLTRRRDREHVLSRHTLESRDLTSQPSVRSLQLRLRNNHVLLLFSFVMCCSVSCWSTRRSRGDGEEIRDFLKPGFNKTLFPGSDRTRKGGDPWLLIDETTSRVVFVYAVFI